MPSLELFSATEPELADRAIEAIEKNDTSTLEQIDSVFRYRFQILARRADYDARTRLIRALLKVLGAAPAKQKPKPDPVQTFLARWELMDTLMAAFRKEVDMVAEGKRQIESRQYVRELLRKVVAAGDTGIPVTQLASEFDVKNSQMSRLVTELEEIQVVERFRSGRYKFVCLGEVGRKLLEQPAGQFKWPADFRNISGALDCHPGKLM